MSASRKNKNFAMPDMGRSNVYPFPRCADRRNRLTLRDRDDAASWADGHARTWCRIVIYADPAEPDEIGDFISIYRLGQAWASWGVARRGGTVCLWRADYGRDIGTFRTMSDALAAIIPPELSLSAKSSVAAGQDSELDTLRGKLSASGA